jgi:serine/threonine protein phosphatase 1
MLGSFFNRLLNRSEPATEFTPPPLAPAESFAAIGDVHGCAELLDALFIRIGSELPAAPVITVGDYIDRGENSAEVLERLYAENTRPGSTLICLTGNHEDMLIKFLDDPEKSGPMWLRNGGLQTLASFGVDGVRPSTIGAPLIKVRDALALKMGDDLISWLRRLPATWTTGNVTVLHAAADPAVPLAEQKRHTLLWGHRDFAARPRSDGQWIVHGHTIVPQPESAGGRIAIDTGAFATGRLTAAIVTPGEVRFLTA